MPVDLATPFKRLLSQIITISQEIRSLALEYATDQNFSTSERLRGQLETVRTSTDAILESFSKATLTSYTLDERMTEWLTRGEPYTCLDTLKEMARILTPDQAQHAPTLPPEDKISASMIFLDRHQNVFRFLLTPDAWSNKAPAHLQSKHSLVNTLLVTDQGESMANTRERGEDGLLPATNQERVPDRKKELLHQKVYEIVRWLSPMECVKKHKDALRLRQEGTCKWFPTTDVYERWRAPGSHFLWVHGKAGCGKSVLIASTIEHLKNGLEEGEVVVFFYCDFQNKRSTSSTELMRSLLSQLLRHICDHGVDPGDFPDKILKQKTEGTLSLDDLKKLCGLASRAASFFRYEPMIVIDALDECADTETLLLALVTLSQSDVRLLVTSRPNQTIVDHFMGLQSLSFEDVAERIAADITLHIRREVNSHNHLRSSVPEVNTKLTEKAEGRFRWVQCQLDTLKRCATREELIEALDSLPNELGATYERILGEIDERKSEGELARRVLALLMVALEPLQLVQIIDGLSMDYQKRTRDHETQRWLETKLLHSLSSLVSYQEETDVLALSHFSVKEYLTNRSALPMWQIVAHEAHAEVVQMCMGYISLYLKQESSHDNLERFPMIFYVLSSGFTHLAHVDSESSMALEAAQSLGSDVRHHPSHWDRFCELREEILEWPYVPWPSSKHDFVPCILITYASPELLRTFLSRSRSLQPRIRTNPFVYAADLRKTEHAIVLLDCGADLEERGLVIDDSYRVSPLEVAIDLGDDVLVSELLQKECTVTSDLLATAVCMPWCSAQVLVRLMQTDEFAEWALGIGDEKLYRGVFSSARPNTGDSRKTDEDHVALARRLSQLGLPLLLDSRFGKDLFVRALYAAHTSMLEFLLPPHQPPPAKYLIAASMGDTSETVPVVRFLLHRGVDVHAVSDEGGETALHLAAMCPWEPRSLELARLLIDAGCDPHALSSDGETPLIVSIKHGHCSVVEFLLSCHVPLPPGILHISLKRRQNPQMIELLLRRGADVHAIAPSTGNTILHDVVAGPLVDGDEKYKEAECFNLVKCSIEAGCDPTTRNFAGETALEMAIDRKLTSVVDLLFSSDVPLPSNILLIASRKHWALDTVKSLIHRGANVNSATSNGDTPLHLALTEYCMDGERCELVRALVDAGCNPALPNSTGETALRKAIVHGYILVAKFLLSLDIPLPHNVLLLALQQRWTPDMIGSLIRRGADVHAIAPSRNTVLHLALKVYDIEQECCELVKKLVDAGCDPTLCNATGETVLEIAISRGYIAIAELLLLCKVPLPPDILLVAVLHHSTLETIEFLVRKGADTHSTTANGDTILHLTLTTYYIEDECCELMERFINAGCNPTSQNSNGETILEKAIKCGYISVIEHLLSCGVPLPPDVLWTALLWPRSSTLDTVEVLIQDGANVHATNPNGDTLLHLALDLYHDQIDRLTLMELFIDAGCNPSLSNSAGETPLRKAIRHKYTSVVQLLIRSGADVRATTPHGDTLLHLVLSAYYTERECLELTKNLIDAGCDPTMPNSSGGTVLDFAIGYGDTLIVDILLSSGISTPSDILLIALRQLTNLEMVEFLINKGADVHCSASNGDTVLHLTLKEYDEEECFELVKTLANAGCDASTCNSDGETALKIAIEREFTSVIEFLFSSGTPSPSNILLVALQRCSSLEALETLIHEGADVHCATSSGNTVLHLALKEYSMEEECREILEMFMNAGCNPTIRDSSGKTVLELAIEYHYALVVGHLLSHNVALPPDVLLTALRQHSTLDMVQFLVQRGAELHSTTSNGDTALHLALTKYSIEQECCKLVRCLLDSGCDPVTCNSERKTVLEFAIERQFTLVVELIITFLATIPPDVLVFALQRHSAPGMVRLLIQKGANIHFITPSGDTVLHFALTEYDVEEESCDLVENFINAGCHPSARNSDTGETALETAIERGYTSVVNLLLSHGVMIPPDVLFISLRRRSTHEMVQFLIQNGADVHSTTSNGSTVLHLALSEYRIEEECFELVQAFIQAGCNPAACRSDGKNVLTAAIERGYISVVQFLLQSSAPLSSDILPIALRCCSTTQILRLLVDKLVSHERLTVSGSDWDSLLQISRASYSSADRQNVIEILESARKAKRMWPSFRDEAYTHAAKRPRLT